MEKADGKEATASKGPSSAGTGRKVRSPAEFLKLVIGQNVIVRLHSGTDYKGQLVCLDGFMNIALENAEEWSNGILHRTYGDAFVRGSNGM